MRHEKRAVVVLSALVVGAITVGCSSESAPAPAPPRAAPAPAPTAPPPPAAAAFAAGLLEAYERARTSLATDELGDLWDAARALETAAAGAAPSAPADLRTHYEQLATACARLREAPRDDAQEARRAFGEVSREMVALVRARPSLGTGLSVYECPMATGYRKWLQRSGAMANPYMGTDAPACGVVTDWSP